MPPARHASEPAVFGLHRHLTETASDAAIDTTCRVLRLPTTRARFPDLVARAEREPLSHRGFLAELLMSECEDRDRQRSERRIRAAGYPRQEWLSDFDYNANPNVVPAVVNNVNNLATCDWVKKGRAALPSRGLRDEVCLGVPGPHLGNRTTRGYESPATEGKSRRSRVTGLRPRRGAAGPTRPGRRDAGLRGFALGGFGGVRTHRARRTSRPSSACRAPRRSRRRAPRRPGRSPGAGRSAWRRR